MRYVLCVLALALFTGCPFPDVRTPAGYTQSLESAEAGYFEDIPIPQTRFYAKPDESFVYLCPEDRNLRVARLVYVGDALVEDVVDDYIRRLPAHDWEPMGEPVRSKHIDRVVMLYRKAPDPTRFLADEQLRVTVEREGESVRLTLELSVLED